MFTRATLCDARHKKTRCFGPLNVSFLRQFAEYIYSDIFASITYIIDCREDTSDQQLIRM